MLARCANATTLPPPITRFPCLAVDGRLPLPLPFGDPPARQVPLLIRWEDYAEYLPADLRDVIFVQIGANCGKNTFGCAVGGDPIWSYATMCGWRGLALEPVSYVYRLLCKNYARWRPRVTPLRGAVAATSGLFTIGLGGGETNKLVDASTRAAVPSFKKKNETVPVITLEQLWHEAGGPVERGRCDILVIDAEGQEANILVGAKLRGLPEQQRPTLLPSPLPALILFEHAHLHGSERVRIHSSLVRQGYTHLADLKNMDPKGAISRPANRLYGHARGGAAGSSKAPS